MRYDIRCFFDTKVRRVDRSDKGQKFACRPKRELGVQSCGAKLRVIACIADPRLIAKILAHARSRTAATARLKKGADKPDAEGETCNSKIPNHTQR